MKSGEVLLHRRFEYKHSFRAPDLAQRDGSIPFWIVHGDAIASNEQLRLAPSMRSRSGIAWNKRPMVESDHFVIDVSLKVTGQGRIGADGLAIWYTSQLGSRGTVYGASDYWTGLGIFLDSFDNDGRKDNPYISVMVNDGTRGYDHQSDGSQQILSGCQKNFRNKPYPVRLKIEYASRTLTIHVSDGVVQDARLELCIRVENIFLPKNGYFGLSAATGGLADDHDILQFNVYSLLTDSELPKASELPQDLRQKYETEFETQHKEFELEKQRFKEQYPEKVLPEEEDTATYYEDALQRDLRLIYEVQTTLQRLLVHMDERTRLILEQQNGQVAMLRSCGISGAQGDASRRLDQNTFSDSGGFSVQEMNEAIQILRDLSIAVRDMKGYVNEIFTRTYNTEQRLGTLTSAQDQMAPGGSDPKLREIVEIISNEVRQIRTSQLAQTSPGITHCPNISCISTSVFLFVSILQGALVLIYTYTKSRQDKAKFY